MHFKPTVAHQSLIYTTFGKTINRKPAAHYQKIYVEIHAKHIPLILKGAGSRPAFKIWRIDHNLRVAQQKHFSELRKFIPSACDNLLHRMTHQWAHNTVAESLKDFPEIIKEIYIPTIW